MLLGNLNLVNIDDTFAYQDNTNEQTIVEILSTHIEPIFLFKVNLDLSNLVQGVIIRVYYKVDGSNYRLRFGTNSAGGLGGEMTWTTLDGDWFVVAIQDILDHDLKITIQASLLAQGSVKNIPYTYNGGR